MPVVVRDDSIGQALGTLASGLMGDPKDAWEATAFKQRVAGIQADNAKKAFELQQLRDQRAAQDAVIGKFDGMFQPENFNVPVEVEGPRPAPRLQGPMPPVFNPEYGALDSKLEFARTAARNAIMRGGSPDQALSASYGALGMGDVLVNGVPTDPAKAAQAQTMLTGKLPDANTPLTEIDRVRMEEEKQQAKLKENVSVPDKGFVILSPEQGKSMGVQPDANGQYIVRNQPAAGGAASTDVFGGEGWQQQASNVLIQYSTAVKSGQPVPPELEMAASIAWENLYGTKIETRTGPDGSTLRVPVQQNAPDGIMHPGGSAQPGPSPGPSTAPLPAPVQPPVSGSVSAPVSGAPAVAPPPDANGVQVLVPGQPKPRTEAVQRKDQFVSTMKVSKTNMDAMFDQQGYVPTAKGQLLNKAATRADGTLTTDIIAVAANGMMNEQDQAYWTAAGNFLNAVLRDESGAAVPEQEYPRYLAALIPQAGDGPERIALKRQLMQAAIDARENAFLSNTPGAAREVAAMIAASPTFQPEAATTQAPAAGTPDRVRLRQDADTAIAKIEASTLPSSVKERKKAEVEQKFNQMIGGQ